MSDLTDVQPGTGLAVIEYPGADEGAADDGADPEHVEGEAVDDGEFSDAAAAVVLAPYEFRARLKGGVPIKRDKDGLVSIEVTLVIWTSAQDTNDVARPILALISENDASALFDVMVTPVVKQGRLV